VGIQQQARDEQVAVAPVSATSRFCYRISSHTILLEVDMRAEVLTAPTVYPVPFAPAWCAGLISLRGELYPVVDMHWVVERRSSATQPQLLLIQHPRFSPAILTCDGYPRQLKLSGEDLMEHKGENLPGWIPHVLHHEGQVLLAADHGRLLRQIQRTQGS
jgi:chemotaxis signal transduction protein